MRESARVLITRMTEPLARGLSRFGVTPCMLTTTGLLLNIAGAAILVVGSERADGDNLSVLGLGCAVILFAGVFDILDGQVARVGGMSSRFGALYDSALDRYSEFLMFFGICYYLLSRHCYVSSLWAFAALAGSMMVSYVRARGEGLGVECGSGLMQRPERIVIITVAGLVCGVVSLWSGGGNAVLVPWIPSGRFETIYIFSIPLAVVAILANLTAVGRINHCRKRMRDDGG